MGEKIRLRAGGLQGVQAGGDLDKETGGRGGLRIKISSNLALSALVRRISFTRSVCVCTTRRCVGHFFLGTLALCVMSESSLQLQHPSFITVRIRVSLPNGETAPKGYQS